MNASTSRTARIKAANSSKEPQTKSGQMNSVAASGKGKIKAGRAASSSEQLPKELDVVKGSRKMLESQHRVKLTNRLNQSSHVQSQ